VVDTTAPSISAAGANATIECSQTPEFTAPSATDACDSNPSVVVVSDMTTPGSCAGSYSRTITWKAVDACGNESGTVSQTINVVDTTAPSISAAGANSTIECSQTPEFTAPSATDACDSNPSVVIVSDVTTQGNCTGSYSRTVTWKAVDVCGNESGLVSQTITAVDTTSPAIGAPGANATIPCTQMVVFTAPTATDACDSNPTVVVVSDVTTPGSCAGSYSRTITWKAVDACGNESGLVSQSINVVDSNAPVVNPYTIQLTVYCGAINTIPLLTANDACSQVIVNYSDQLFSGGCPGTIVRDYTFSDGCGNHSYATQFITLIDTVAPVFSSIPVARFFECGDTYTQPATPVATDVCDSDVEITHAVTNAPGNCPQEIFVTHTWTAQDDCDNTTMVSVTDVVTVCPEIQNVVACDHYLWYNTNYTQSGIYEHTEIVNGCEIVYAISLTINHSSFSNFSASSCASYNWNGTIYDSSGVYTQVLENAANCDSTVTLNLTIIPYVTPTFSAVGPYCNGSAIPALPNVSNNGISGTWSPAISNTVSQAYTFTPNAGQCATTATISITITPNVTPTFAAVGPYCTGVSIPALPVVSNNGISGTWSPAISNTASQTYTFTPNAGQCATTATLTININTLSVAPTSISATSTSVPLGISTTLTVNGGSLGSGATWKWYSGSCGGVFVGSGNSIVVTPTATTTYFVRAEGLCNTTVCVSRTITVTSSCGPQTVTSNAPNNITCNGTPVTLTVGGTLSSGAVWRWYKTSCGGTLVGSGTSLAVIPATTTTYFVRSEGGVCGTTSCLSITITVNSIPLRPNAITGPAHGVCNALGVVYCVNPVAGATGYQWSVPTGATIVSGLGTSCITVNFSGELGVNAACGYSGICVSATNACGSSETRCLNLFNAPTGNAVLSGPSTANQGSTTTYSVSAVYGASYYSWTVPAGWTILSGQGTNSISVQVGANAGHVKVMPTNACGNGKIFERFVTVASPGRRDAEVEAEAEVEEVPDALLYPNPANDIFYIESGDALPSLIEVLDISGKVVFTGSGSRSVTTDQWSTGMYLVRIHFVDQVQVKRVQILH
jgi:hypothetical protein